MNKKLIAMLFFMAPLALFAQKFGHLNSADIIQVMPEYTAAQTELQNLEKQYTNELQLMETELAKKSDTRKNRINAILAEAAKRAEAAKNAASA